MVSPGSWVLRLWFLFVFFPKERRAWDPSVGRSAHPSAFPRAKPERGREERERETERPCECGGQVRVTHVRVYKHREGFACLDCFHTPGRAKRAPAACFPTKLTAADASGIMAEESEANAARAAGHKSKRRNQSVSLMHEGKTRRPLTWHRE